MTETKQENAAGCMCAGYGPRLSALAELLMPSGEAGQHFKQAHIEVLKGLRAVLDQRIEAMSAGPVHGTKLNVD